MLHDYPPLVELHGEIQTLLTKADRVVDVQEKLASGGNLTGDDLKFPRENHELFTPEPEACHRKASAIATRRVMRKLVPAFPAFQVIDGSRARE